MASTKRKRKSDTKLGWHFLPADLRLTNGDGRKVSVGVPLSMQGSGPPITCNQGMHASVKINQAAVFERGPVLSRVRVSGAVDVASDKFCGRTRTVLWMKEIRDSDVQDIALAMGQKHAVVTGAGVEYTLKNLARLNAAGFNRAVENWASANGLLGKKALAVKPALPTFEEKDLLRLLAPRVIRTKKEILRDIGSCYDMRAHDSMFDDRFDEIIDDCDRVINVDNVDGYGNNGYALRGRRR